MIDETRLAEFFKNNSEAVCGGYLPKGENDISRRLNPQDERFPEQSLCPASRWVAYCDTLTWAKGLLDESSYVAFLRAGSLNIRPDIAFQEVARRIRLAGDCPKAHKLERQLRRAYAFVRTSNRNGFTREFGLLCSKSSKPIFRPEKLAQIAGRSPETVDKEYLALRSKFTPWNRSPAGFLHKLYQPGESIVVFDVFESQGCAVWKHPGLVGNLSTLDFLQLSRFGVWYLCNPVDGQYHWNPREQKKSRRSEEAITSWRYAVVESDEADPQLWLKALVQLPLPISAIYCSGGRSIHTLLYVQADSKGEWDHIIRHELGPILICIGADPSAFSAVRLTRLPNCRREQTGHLQELLYLDDDPDAMPIAQKSRNDRSRFYQTISQEDSYGDAG
jgi:hypothetical protein